MFHKVAVLIKYIDLFYDNIYKLNLKESQPNCNSIPVMLDALKYLLC